ncbi:MAG: M48 family metalloprotease [Thiotrichaceae bacterium]
MRLRCRVVKLEFIRDYCPVANTQHQLAAVLGHEISHVLLGHGGERMSQDTLADIGVKVVGAYWIITQQGQLAIAALG